MIRGILGYGHTLYVDNFYTSEELFLYLNQNETGACGTVRKNRVKLPIEFKTKKLDKGETTSISNGTILAMRFNDKRDVMFLSTVHPNNKLVSAKDKFNGEVNMKQKLIVDYNKHMGYVDKNDQMLSSHTCLRKCIKWTTKAAFHFLEEAVFNAFVLFKKKNNRIVLKDFKLKLLEQLIGDGTPNDLPFQQPRLLGKHFPVPIHATPRKANPTRKCVVCTKNKLRRESRYQCADCPDKPSLCIHPCFKIFHPKDSF